LPDRGPESLWIDDDGLLDDHASVAVVDPDLAGHPRCGYASCQPPPDRLRSTVKSARRQLAAYLLNAVAPSVLDRTLSSGDIDATQLAGAARQLCAASPARLRSVERTRSGNRAGRLSARPDCGLPRTRS
jgi:hypothetical protein